MNCYKDSQATWLNQFDESYIELIHSKTTQNTLKHSLIKIKLK